MKSILFILILFLNIFSFQLKCEKLKMLHFDDFIIDKLEISENNSEYFYSIGQKNFKSYYSFSQNGYQNLELKYIDTIILENGIIKYKPLIPFSLKSANNNIFVGCDNSKILVFDNFFTIIDTITLSDDLLITDYIFKYQGGLLFCCYNEIEQIRKIYFYDNIKIIELDFNKLNSIYKDVKLNVYNENEIYFIGLSQIKSDSNLFVQNIYSTKNKGVIWDSVKINNQYFSHIIKFTDDEFYGIGTRLKYPENSDNKKFVNTFIYKNKNEEKIIDIEIPNLKVSSYNFFMNSKNKFIYGIYNLIIPIENDLFDVVNFEELNNNFKNLEKLNICEIDSNKLILTGAKNYIIELNLDLISSIYFSNKSLFNIYPNPTFEKLNVNLNNLNLQNLTITNVIGEVVYNINVLKELNNDIFTIDLNSLNLPKGVYFISGYGKDIYHNQFVIN